MCNDSTNGLSNISFNGKISSNNDNNTDSVSSKDSNGAIKVDNNLVSDAKKNDCTFGDNVSDIKQRWSKCQECGKAINNHQLKYHVGSQRCRKNAEKQKVSNRFPSSDSGAVVPSTGEDCMKNPFRVDVVSSKQDHNKSTNYELDECRNFNTQEPVTCISTNNKNKKERWTRAQKRSELNTHVATTHDEDILFECRKCNIKDQENIIKETTSKICFCAHLRDSHGKYMALLCKHCGDKTLLSKDAMFQRFLRHLRRLHHTHT